MWIEQVSERLRKHLGVGEIQTIGFRRVQSESNEDWFTVKVSWRRGGYTSNAISTTNFAIGNQLQLATTVSRRKLSETEVEEMSMSDPKPQKSDDNAVHLWRWGMSSISNQTSFLRHALFLIHLNFSLNGTNPAIWSIFHDYVIFFMIFFVFHTFQLLRIRFSVVFIRIGRRLLHLCARRILFFQQK